MPKTITAEAELERAKQSVKVIWLIELEAVEPGVGTEIQYWASRTYSLGGNDYEDVLVPDSEGLRIDWRRLRVTGGLPQIGRASMTLTNVERLHHLLSTYNLNNDEVRIYQLLIPPDDSEVEADRVRVFSGVIEETDHTVDTWKLEAIDVSDRDFRPIPADKIDLIRYTNAPLASVEKVIPVVFGDLDRTPQDGSGAFPFLAPCRCVDQFNKGGMYTCTLQGHTYGDLFQYYPTYFQAAKVTDVTPSGGFFVINDVEREMHLNPILPLGTNDVDLYYLVIDGNIATSVTIGSGDNLDLRFGGIGKIGTLTAISLEIVAEAGHGYDYEVFYKGVSEASGSVTGPQSIPLTPADYDWDFENLTLEIDGTGDATFYRVYLELTYDDLTPVGQTGLPIFQEVNGWIDAADNYRDGSPVVLEGVQLKNPVDILQAILRGKVLFNRSVAELNLASFSTARAFRTDWEFAFSMDAEVDPASFVNEFCFQARLHLFQNHEQKWTVKVIDHTADASHTFLQGWNIDVPNAASDPSEWLEDLRFSLTPRRQVLTEISLRYGLDRMGGDYSKGYTHSARYRFSNEDDAPPVASIVDNGDDTGTLTDANAEFVTQAVKAGETVYVRYNAEYLVVDDASSQTQLIIEPKIDGHTIDEGTALTYYIGPNLDARMVLSLLRYNTLNALGVPQRNVRDEGGYKSDFIDDDDTAEALVENLTLWESERKIVVELGTFWNALDVEEGDLCYFDHVWLEPENKRPQGLVAVAEAIDSTETVWDIAGGLAGLVRTGDRLLVDYEIVEVTNVDLTFQQITVVRGVAHSLQAAHADSSTLYRFITKFVVMGVQPVPSEGKYQLILREAPRDYTPGGTWQIDVYPDYDTATELEKQSSGWHTYQSGLVDEDDPDSAISYWEAG